MHWYFVLSMIMLRLSIWIFSFRAIEAISQYVTPTYPTPPLYFNQIACRKVPPESL